MVLTNKEYDIQDIIKVRAFKTKTSSSHYVTLPFVFCQEFKIKKGDVLKLGFLGKVETFK